MSQNNVKIKQDADGIQNMSSLFDGSYSYRMITLLKF